MKTVSLTLTVSLLVSVAMAQTNEPTVRRLSLMDTLQEAIQRNLDVQIKRYDPQIRRYNLSGSYAGWDPELKLDGTHKFSLAGGGYNADLGTNTLARREETDVFQGSVGGLLPWGLTYNVGGNIFETYGEQNQAFDSTRGNVGIDLVQPLLKNFWIDQTRLGIALAKNRLKYDQLGLRLQLMNVVTATEKAYFDLIAAREGVRVQEKGLQLAEQSLSENKKRVEVGTMAPLDEKQAQSEVAARRADLLNAKLAVGLAENTLRGLLNYRYDDEIEPVDDLTAPEEKFNILSSLTKGMELRPDLLQAKLDVERDGLQLKYDKNQLFPQLDVVGGYGHGAGGDGISEFSQGLDQFRQGNQPNHYYGGRLIMPLSNLAARNNFKASKLFKEQTFLKLKKLEQEIVSSIDRYVITARTAYQSLDSRREARLYAEAAVQAEQKKLESGKSTSFVVLQLQRDLTAAQSEEIKALADYNKALADLALGEGSTLERRRVDVEVK